MESVARGLAALPPCDYVAIHDGARPLCPPAHIDQIVRAAHTFGAAVPGLPVRDSVKTRLGLLVKEDVNRDTLVTVQTPQVFPTEEYDAVLAYALDKKLQVTDDAAVYAILQKPIHIVEGLRRNLKVTTPEDLPLAEFYLETEEEQRRSFASVTATMSTAWSRAAPSCWAGSTFPTARVCSAIRMRMS